MKKRDYLKVKKLQDLTEYAWTIIANTGSGDWTKESPDWQTAAAKWRDKYHLTLNCKSDNAAATTRKEA